METEWLREQNTVYIRKEKEGTLAFLDMLVKRGETPVQQKFTRNKLTPKKVVIGHQIIPELFYLGY